MYNNNHGKNSDSSTRGFIGLIAALVMGLGAIACPALAAPFAYVANINSNTVSVIDTATNKVVGLLCQRRFPSTRRHSFCPD